MKNFEEIENRIIEKADRYSKIALVIIAIGFGLLIIRNIFFL